MVKLKTAEGVEMNKGCKYCKHFMRTKIGFEVRHECAFEPETIMVVNPVEGIWSEKSYGNCYTKNASLDCPDFDDKPTFKEFIKMLFRRA